jgi:hypothetical protein
MKLKTLLVRPIKQLQHEEMTMLINHHLRINRTIKKTKLWRALILHNDNYTCQCCGRCPSNLRNLHTHHLYGKDYIKNPIRYKLKNGTTLCATCHRKFHYKHGNEIVTPHEFQHFMIACAWSLSSRTIVDIGNKLFAPDHYQETKPLYNDTLLMKRLAIYQVRL